jgi:hypothetical protein
MNMNPSVQIGLVSDMTGSMRPVSAEVRRNNGRLIKSAFASIPALEMGVVAVGDDLPGQGAGYMTKVLKPQRDWDAVSRFVETVPPAYGGDFDECYELALNDLGKFPWHRDAKKVVIFFGDACPHPVRHHKNPKGLNWEVEARKLAEQGVTIHSVHCLAHYGEKAFWQKLAKIGGGVYFQLDQWSHVESLVLGIAQHAFGGVEALQRYETEMQTRQSIPVGIRRSFDALAGRRSAAASRRDGRTPLAEQSRFQVLTCDATERQDIQDFAVSQGLIVSKGHFNGTVKGHCFYAHTERTEELRPNHHVVIQDNSTDEMFSGEEAREWLDCPTGQKKSIKPNPLGEGYTVWFQSKSVNRKIFPGQKVMVEMTDAIKGAMAEVEALC